MYMEYECISVRNCVDFISRSLMLFYDNEMYVLRKVMVTSDGVALLRFVGVG